SLGSVGEWLYGDVAGISQSPDSIAFRDLIINPHPGGRLTWAKASYDTPTGRVSTYWKVAEGKFTLDVTIPPGATATIHIPTTDPDSVAESGHPLAVAEGLSPLEPTDTTAVCRARPGTYHFTARA